MGVAPNGAGTTIAAGARALLTARAEAARFQVRAVRAVPRV